MFGEQFWAQLTLCTQLQGCRNFVKTGWARSQILTTSTVGAYTLHDFCHFEGFIASDI